MWCIFILQRISIIIIYNSIELSNEFPTRKSFDYILLLDQKQWSQLNVIKLNGIIFPLEEVR